MGHVISSIIAAALV